MLLETTTPGLAEQTSWLFTPVQIAPGNDGAKSDTPSVDAIAIVPDPRNSIGNTGVNSPCSQEDSKVR